MYIYGGQALSFASLAVSRHTTQTGETIILLWCLILFVHTTLERFLRNFLHITLQAPAKSQTISKGIFF